MATVGGWRKVKLERASQGNGQPRARERRRPPFPPRIGSAGSGRREGMADTQPSARGGEEGRPDIDLNVGDLKGPYVPTLCFASQTAWDL